jgi:hypothetical protein
MSGGVLLGTQEQAMKYGFLAPLMALAVGAGLARGQEGTPPANSPLLNGFIPAYGDVYQAGYGSPYGAAGQQPLAESVMPVAPTVPDGDAGHTVGSLSATGQEGSLYVFSADYLSWYLKSASGTVYPLVTGGTTASLGRVGSPGTTELFGTSPFDNNPSSGFRLTSAVWFGCDHLYGWDASGFLLLRKSQTNDFTNFFEQGVLARPFINADTGKAASLLVALPGYVQGSVSVGYTSEMFGAETNFLARWYDGPNYTLVGSAGFRYVGLDETLGIESFSQLPAGSTAFFRGIPITGPAGIAVHDQFNTNNQFYGGQVGLMGELRCGKFFIDAGGKVAIGAIQQQIEILGNTTAYLNRIKTPISVPGGLLATSSNIGTYRDDVFAFVPTGTIKLGYQVAKCMNVYVGYDGMYISRVVRPSDQIDPVVNTAFVPTSPNFGSATAIFRPGVSFTKTDFFVQGFSIGTSITW